MLRIITVFSVFLCWYLYLFLFASFHLYFHHSISLFSWHSIFRLPTHPPPLASSPSISFSIQCPIFFLTCLFSMFHLKTSFFSYYSTFFASNLPFFFIHFPYITRLSFHFQILTFHLLISIRVLSLTLQSLLSVFLPLFAFHFLQRRCPKLQYTNLSSAAGSHYSHWLYFPLLQYFSQSPLLRNLINLAFSPWTVRRVTQPSPAISLLAAESFAWVIPAPWLCCAWERLVKSQGPSVTLDIEEEEEQKDDDETSKTRRWKKHGNRQKQAIEC